MRNYPTDSPHAGARTLAIAMLIDGHADLSEIRALERTDCSIRAKPPSSI